MTCNLLNSIPDVVVIGSIEMLFLGMAVAVGAPKATRRALKRRYDTGGDATEDGTDESE